MNSNHGVGIKVLALYEVDGNLRKRVGTLLNWSKDFLELSDSTFGSVSIPSEAIIAINPSYWNNCLPTLRVVFANWNGCGHKEVLGRFVAWSPESLDLQTKDGDLISISNNSIIVVCVSNREVDS